MNHYILHLQYIMLYTNYTTWIKKKKSWNFLRLSSSPEKAKLFCKGSHSNYFRLYRMYGFSVLWGIFSSTVTTQLCPNSRKATTYNTWVNETLFLALLFCFLFFFLKILYMRFYLNFLLLLLVKGKQFCRGKIWLRWLLPS